MAWPLGFRCRWMRWAAVEPGTLPTGIIGRDPEISIVPMARGRHTHRRHVGAIATIVVAVAGVVLLVFGGVAYAAYRYEMGHADRILPGVTIAGVDVGGMTRAEATQKVGALVRDDLRGQLTVTVGEDHWTTTLAALGRQAAVKRAVESAMHAGSGMGTFDRAWHRIRHEALGVDLPVEYRTTGDGVDLLVLRIARDVYVAPRHASIGPGPGRWGGGRAARGRPRPRQSDGSACALHHGPRVDPHPRDERPGLDRTLRVPRLHPHAERGRHHALSDGAGRNARVGGWLPPGQRRVLGHPTQQGVLTDRRSVGSA